MLLSRCPMSKKWQYILEGILVIVLIIAYSVIVVIPEYQKNKGSSQGFIETSRYENMIEVQIPSKLDVGFVLDSEGKIYHLFFFDKNAANLYNKNIENKEISKSLEKAIPILVQNGLIQEGDQIEFIRNNDSFYQEFQNSWNELILSYFIHTETLEKVVSLKDRVLEIGVEEDSTSSLLLNLDFYSKEFVRDLDQSVVSTSKFNEEIASQYADNIYLKLEEYVLKNNIQSLDRYNTELVVSLIPAEESLHYYPTTRSYFMVVEGKVTAFIEFQEDDTSFGFCYRGSLDSKEKGECTS